MGPHADAPAGSDMYNLLSKNMSEFQEYLNATLFVIEGGTGPITHMFLASLIWGLQARLVYEIGMNAGTCSLRLLNALEFTDGRLHLFELDQKKAPAFNKLHSWYGERVYITWGDSAATLPMVTDESPDLIFVDGYHGADGVKVDVENSVRLVRPGGYVVLDDWVYAPSVAHGACSVIPKEQWLLFGQGLSTVAIYQKPVA